MLEFDEPEDTPTFQELSAEWFETIKTRFVDPGNERRHLKRLNDAIGNLTEKTLLPGRIQRAIAGMTDLGPATKNKVRSTGSRVVNAARMDGKWRAANPFDPVERAEIPKPAYDTLTLEEARAVLKCVRPDRADLFRVALVMGGRKGELFGMRKEDVDLAARIVWIRRSHGRNTTKTYRPRKVPIPAAALASLRAAITSSPCDLVFPCEGGAQFRHDTKLTRILRVAMAAAGIVLGFDAKCRHRGCGRVVRVRLREAKACPKCGYEMWLVPRVRPIRFYDLRHTAATLHREAGCDPLVIKLLLGHAAQDPTDDTYTHLSMDYQRRQLDKLKL